MLLSVLYCMVQLCPENTEEFIDYLKSIGRLDEAAIKLSEIVNKVPSAIRLFCGIFACRRGREKSKAERDRQNYEGENEG